MIKIWSMLLITQYELISIYQLVLCAGVPLARVSNPFRESLCECSRESEQAATTNSLASVYSRGETAEERQRRRDRGGETAEGMPEEMAKEIRQHTSWNQVQMEASDGSIRWDCTGHPGTTDTACRCYKPCV